MYHLLAFCPSLVLVCVVSTSLGELRCVGGGSLICINRKSCVSTLPALAFVRVTVFRRGVLRHAPRGACRLEWMVSWEAEGVKACNNRTEAFCGLSPRHMRLDDLPELQMADNLFARCAAAPPAAAATAAVPAVPLLSQHRCSGVAV